MARVKTTDPYASGFFDDARPAPELASDPVPAQPESDAELSDAAGKPPSSLVPSRGEAVTSEASTEPDTQAKVRLNADIDRDLHRRLRIRVASEGITIADFIRDILQRELR